MLYFGVLPDVKLLVPLLVGKSAAVELGDRPQPGQNHQSQGQEGQSHGWAAGWKSKEEPKRPSHFVSVWSTECHSCPRPLRTDASTPQHSVLPWKPRGMSVFPCAVISCNMVSIGGGIQRSAPLCVQPSLTKVARNRAVPLLMRPDATCCSDCPHPLI